MKRSRAPENTMGDSPTKRRKTRGFFGMNFNRITKMPSWPAKKLPVELFTIIISYLPRSTIQSMRLVNHEFEEKVSEYLFRVVVVPFKPEIYGITPDSVSPRASEAMESDLSRGSIMLQDKGMRVFEGFGRHILRFAMSFEFDEVKLARPPIKSEQEAITSFWGIYRWPFKKYNRYAQLEGLEQTADETRTMAKALRFIKNAQELALSIDGGLGWLAGPDVNQKFVDRGSSVVVFGGSRFPPDSKPKSTKAQKVLNGSSRLTTSSWANLSSASSAADSAIENQHDTLQRMLQEAGYQGETLEHSVDMMLESEESSGVASQELEAGDSFSSNYNGESLRASLTDRLSHAAALFTTAIAGHESDDLMIGPDSDDEDEITDFINPHDSRIRNKAEHHALKPNDLTNAQKEVLLETEWAQRAFMQSYAIAIIDNPITFNNVQSFTIARLPHRHLSILRREDFWDSLPSLRKVSLGIIPDWRDVIKLPTSWVQDNKVAPSVAVTGVFQLLHEQISRRSNIKTLRIEWLCGGEEAPGLFARNQHVLAAPIVSKPMEMVNRRDPAQLLSLPYIEHLSLKNCWVSPHILTKFGLSLREGLLKSLELSSVSLTAPLRSNAQPGPLPATVQHAFHAANHAAANVFLHNHAVNQMVAAQNGLLQAALPGGPPVALPAAPAAAPPVQIALVNNQPAPSQHWLEEPRSGSWAQTIDALTPGPTLAALRYAQEMGPEPPTRGGTALTKLTFASCGYIRVPLDFDQSVLTFDAPDIAGDRTGHISKRISDLDPFMMKPLDWTLGTIVNYMDPNERRCLENAWNMTLGWNDCRNVLATEAHVDGVLHAGEGRFSGAIEVPASTGSSHLQ